MVESWCSRARVVVRCIAGMCFDRAIEVPSSQDPVLPVSHRATCDEVLLPGVVFVNLLQCDLGSSGCNKPRETARDIYHVSQNSGF